MKNVIKNLLKKAKKYRGFIIFFIIMLSINTYAWFAYITRIDTSITAKLRSWNVMFQVHDNNIASDVNFEIGDIYPGMPNYSDLASIVNTGESAGSVSFTVKSVRILDNTYTLTNYTSDELIEMLASDYPFSITIGLSDEVVMPGSTETFDLGVVWPYESGNDDLDTTWGRAAYTYKQSHPNSPSIVITAEVRVNQNNEATDGPSNSSSPSPTDNG